MSTNRLRRRGLSPASEIRRLALEAANPWRALLGITGILLLRICVVVPCVLLIASRSCAVSDSGAAADAARQRSVELAGYVDGRGPPASVSDWHILLR